MKTTCSVSEWNILLVSISQPGLYDSIVPVLERCYACRSYPVIILIQESRTAVKRCQTGMRELTSLIRYVPRVVQVRNVHPHAGRQNFGEAMPDHFA